MPIWGLYNPTRDKMHALTYTNHDEFSRNFGMIYAVYRASWIQSSTMGPVYTIRTMQPNLNDIWPPATNQFTSKPTWNQRICMTYTHRHIHSRFSAYNHTYMNARYLALWPTLQNPNKSALMTEHCWPRCWWLLLVPVFSNTNKKRFLQS